MQIDDPIQARRQDLFVMNEESKVCDSEDL